MYLDKLFYITLTVNFFNKDKCDEYYLCNGSKWKIDSAKFGEIDKRYFVYKKINKKWIDKILPSKFIEALKRNKNVKNITFWQYIEIECGNENVPVDTGKLKIFNRKKEGLK